MRLLLSIALVLVAFEATTLGADNYGLGPNSIQVHLTDLDSERADLIQPIFFQQPAPANVVSPSTSIRPRRGRTSIGRNRSRTTGRRSSRRTLFDLGTLDLSLADSSGAPQLTDAPEHMGDAFGSGGKLFAFDGVSAFADVPLASGSRRLKVSENNRALPTDRLFMIYQNFHNALEADASRFFVGPDRRTYDVDRIIIGGEKTFHDGLFSLEVRMPFVADAFAFATPNFGIEGGDVGNLGVIFKTLLWQDENSAYAAGVALDLPTGSDVTGQVNGLNFLVRNESVHISPFVAATRTNGRWFCHAFGQVDIAANGNPLILNSFLGPTEFGKHNDQTLLHLDMGIGKWLLFQPEQKFKGIAAFAELHYTGSLQESDVVSGTRFLNTLTYGNLVGSPVPGFPRVLIPSANSINVLNTTLGLHIEYGKTNIRFGGVLPLRPGPDQQFDAEFNMQINRRF